MYEPHATLHYDLQRKYGPDNIADSVLIQAQKHTQATQELLSELAAAKKELTVTNAHLSTANQTNEQQLRELTETKENLAFANKEIERLNQQVSELKSKPKTRRQKVWNYVKAPLFFIVGAIFTYFLPDIVDFFTKLLEG